MLAPSFSLYFFFPRLLRAVLDFFLLFVSSYGTRLVLPSRFLFFLLFRASSHLCFPCPVKFLAPVITRLSASVLHLCVIVSHCLLYWSTCLVSLSVATLFIPLWAPRSSSRLLPRFSFVIGATFGWMAFLGPDLLFSNAWLLRLCVDLIASTVFNLLSPSRSLYCWPHPVLSWIISVVLLMLCCTTKINKWLKRRQKHTGFSCLEVKVNSRKDVVYFWLNWSLVLAC